MFLIEIEIDDAGEVEVLHATPNDDDGTYTHAAKRKALLSSTAMGREPAKPKSKSRRSKQRKKKRRQHRPRTSVPRLSFTVPEFCEAVNISRSTYEKLKRQRRNPVEMVIGKSIRISQAAAEDWICEREKDRAA